MWGLSVSWQLLTTWGATQRICSAAISRAAAASDIGATPDLVQGKRWLIGARRSTGSTSSCCRSAARECFHGCPVPPRSLNHPRHRVRYPAYGALPDNGSSCVGAPAAARKCARQLKSCCRLAVTARHLGDASALDRAHAASSAFASPSTCADAPIRRGCARASLASSLRSTLMSRTSRTHTECGAGDRSRRAQGFTRYSVFPVEL